MKCMVLGKEFVSGRSKKTGNDFASNVVHVSHKKNGVEGLVVESIWLDPASYPLPSICVGAEYDVDRDSRGYVLDFRLA